MVGRHRVTTVLGIGLVFALIGIAVCVSALGVLVLVVWPWVNQQTAEIKTRYEQRSDLSRVAPGAFQSSSDGSRVFFIERNGDAAGVARNVFLLTTKNEAESVTTAHSGHIELQSEPGRGTKVTVSLPTKPPSAA